MPLAVALIASSGLLQSGMGIVGTGVQGALSLRATREAQKEAREMYEEESAERMRQFEIGTGLSRKSLQIQERQQEANEWFQQAQVRQKRDEFQFMKGQYAQQRMDLQYSKILDMMNRDENLKNALLAKLTQRPREIGYVI